MRFGMSWPTGRGRRVWISGSIIEWLTWIPVFAAFWLAAWIVGGTIWLIVAGIRAIIRKLRNG